ncbi:cysteine protease ATG4D-like [Lineus longissimus]|uniref:cysteine protease ATG4D-like n=1 Tax=Lineus longissimus TaxID=88925 RepID=UPI00315D7E23
MKRQPVSTSWHRENDSVIQDMARSDSGDVLQRFGSFSDEFYEISSQSKTHTGSSVGRNGGYANISDEADRNSPFRVSQTSVESYSRSPSGKSPPIWHTGISPRAPSNGGNQNPVTSTLHSLQPDSGFESGKNFAEKMDVFDCDGDDDAEDTDGPPLAPASPEMEQELCLDMVCSRYDTRRREMAEWQHSSETCSGHPSSMMLLDSWSDTALATSDRSKIYSRTNQGSDPRKSSCDIASEDKHLEDKTSDVKTREKSGRSNRIQSFTSWSEADSSKSLCSYPDSQDVRGRQVPIDEDHSFASWSVMPETSYVNRENAKKDDILPNSPTRGAGTESNGAKSKLNLKDRLVATFSPTPRRSTPPSMTQSLVGPDDVRNIRGQRLQGNDFHYVGLNRGHGGGNFFTVPLSANGIQLPDNYGQVDQSEKLKTKMMSFWNNMKYGWTVKTSTTFSDDKPLFLLGKCYHRKIDESESERRKPSSVDQFKQDFISRIWFTYRREFPQLAGSTFTTDCGWGCMLRSGQMMLAQALVLHFLGRDWRWHAPQTFEQEAYHRQIVKWFGDLPSDHSPFSVHRLVRFGERCLNKKPGDWYGPSSVAHIMKDAIEQGCELNPLLGKICLYIAQDCTVFIDDVMDLCMSRPRSFSRSDTSFEGSDDHSARSEDTWRSVIILIPIRLGGETLNPIYIPCVQSLFALDSCIGIIGGRPKHSLYFVGWQGDKLVHLDPHYCQDVVNMKKREFPLYTYHCISPRKMSFTRMDPSCTVGFYCRTKEDFFTFIKTTKPIVAPPMQKSPYPMFIFVDGRSSDKDQGEHLQREERYVRVRHLDEFGRTRSPSHSSEEFVFL